MSEPNELDAGAVEAGARARMEAALIAWANVRHSAGDMDPRMLLYSDSHREAMTAALEAADAYLAAAPPERHDAPGVSVPADMLLNWRRVVNFSIQAMTDEEWQSQLNTVMREMSELTHELRVRLSNAPSALTGQPDAKEEERR